jgi:hypothetical protein
MTFLPIPRISNWIKNWIRNTVGGLSIPEFLKALPEEKTGSQASDIDSQEVTDHRDTGWMHFEIPENNSMDVDVNPDRGIKRPLNEDDETWSISRKTQMSPEKKRIRLCADSVSIPTRRPFICKWNRKNQQLRKFGRRRRVNVTKSPAEFVIHMNPEPVEPISSFCLPPAYAVMPVTQSSMMSPMMPSVNEPSNDVVSVQHSDVVPRNRKPNSQRNDRTKNKVGAIYTAKGAAERKGNNHRHH